jgi:hypothetical protein
MNNILSLLINEEGLFLYKNFTGKLQHICYKKYSNLKLFLDKKTKILKIAIKIIIEEVKNL